MPILAKISDIQCAPIITLEIAPKLAKDIKMPYKYGLYLNPFLTARPNQIKTMTNMVAAWPLGNESYLNTGSKYSIFSNS